MIYEIQLRKRNTLLVKNISLILFSKGAHSLRDRWRDIYSERGLLLARDLLPGARGANACTNSQAVSSETTLTPLIGCVSMAQHTILTGLSKSDRVFLISRGLPPVTHLLNQPTPTHCYPPVY